MKRIIPFGLIILTLLSLMSCYTPQHPPVRNDLTREVWMREIDANPNNWARGADSWFMSGNPNLTEMMSKHAPYSAAISTTSVRVPMFTNLKVNGDFQVQLIGTNGPNTVYLYGPNDSVRDIVVQVRANTLCLSQIKKARNPRTVIVRIGINQIHRIMQLGRGSIEGISLRSNELNIVTLGPGNIYLGGPVNLHRVVNKGGGVISVFGARASCLYVWTSFGGSVNVSGDVGIRSIVHYGSANIFITGAHSPDLRVTAEGAGKIGLYGHNIRLHEVTTRGSVGFFAFNVNSSGMYVHAYGNSCIGLAGYVCNLFVDTFGTSHFQGRSLCAENAYIRAHDWSHINVSANTKIFSSSTQNGMVYYFGPSTIMSQFVSGNGAIIPIFGQGIGVCAIPTKTRYNTYSNMTRMVAPPRLLPTRIETPHPYSKPVAAVVTKPKPLYVPHETLEVPFTASTRTANKASEGKPPVNKLVGQG